MEEKIFHMAGATTPQQQSIAALEHAIREARRIPVQRDSYYRHLNGSEQRSTSSQPRSEAKLACAKECRNRQPLRIGCVKYLNARPLVFGGPADVVLDHPSVLCAQLADGELDVALVSSFEFLRNPIYRIVDGISISSDGPVYSVVVAHVGEISAAEQIELDPAAETSGNLLRCLLSELKLRPRFVATSTSSLAKERARLLIGDQGHSVPATAWKRIPSFGTSAKLAKPAGLPFVYALWLVRPEVVDPKSIADRLRALRNKNLTNIDNLIAGERNSTAFLRPLLPGASPIQFWKAREGRPPRLPSIMPKTRSAAKTRHRVQRRVMCRSATA